MFNSRLSFGEDLDLNDDYLNEEGVDEEIDLSNQKEPKSLNTNVFMACYENPGYCAAIVIPFLALGGFYYDYDGALDGNNQGSPDLNSMHSESTCQPCGDSNCSSHKHSMLSGSFDDNGIQAPRRGSSASIQSAASDSSKSNDDGSLNYDFFDGINNLY